MRILLTGASGYLGTQLQSILVRNGHECHAPARSSHHSKARHDLTDKKSVFELLKMSEPEIIIHCAAFVPKTLDEYANSERSNQNTLMMENLVDLSTCPIIYISSMTVYGESSKIIRAESDAGNPLTSYGQSKLNCELLLQQSNINSLALRIPGLFGQTRTQGLIYNLLNDLIHGNSPNLPKAPLLWAAMDVKDAAETISQLVETRFSGFNPINIGYPDNYSINQLVNIVEQLFEIQLDYEVPHPVFKFDLTKLNALGLNVDKSLKGALINYKEFLQCS